MKIVHLGVTDLEKNLELFLIHPHRYAQFATVFSAFLDAKEVVPSVAAMIHESLQLDHVFDLVM